MKCEGSMLDFRDEKDGVAFPVFVLPRSSRSMVAGLHNGALKLKLTSPPVDNAANKECVAFLSKALKVPKSSIDILSGHTNRNKQLLIRCQGKKDDKSERMEIRKKVQALIP